MKRVLALAATGLLWTAGCFTDQSQEGGGTGDPACVEGSVTCPCYPNSTCDATLACFESLQVCIPDNCGTLVAGCPCPTDGCGDSLVCDGGLCVAIGPATNSSGSNDSGSSGSVDSGSTSSTSSTTVDPSSTGDPPTATAVTLYFSPSLTPFSSGAGTIDSRATAQALCDTSMTLVNNSCLLSAALISTGEGDSVLDLPDTAGMPFSVPVHNTLNEEIALSFQDLLDDGAETSLQNRAISLADMPGQVPEFFWCGSHANGANGPNCEGWTLSDAKATGKGGYPSVNEPMSWLSNNDIACDQSAPVLCACWD